MHRENLLVDNSGDGQTIEAISEGLPKLDVVPALAFVVEAINTVDGGAFMVASKDEEVLGIFDLVG